jgi:hypothetical protein
VTQSLQRQIKLYFELRSIARKEWAVAGERAEIVRHEDNLHPEGAFQIPEPQVIQPSRYQNLR